MWIARVFQNTSQEEYTPMLVWISLFWGIFSIFYNILGEVLKRKRKQLFLKSNQFPNIHKETFFSLVVTTIIKFHVTIRVKCKYEDNSLCTAHKYFTYHKSWTDQLLHIINSCPFYKIVWYVVNNQFNSFSLKNSASVIIKVVKTSGSISS